MKKIISAILVFLVMFTFVGCNNSSPAKVMSNNITKSTEKLSKLLQNLDDLNSDDIEIKDISPIANKINEDTNVNKTTSYKKVTKNNINKYNNSTSKTTTKNVKNPTYSANNLTKRKSINLSIIGLDNPNNSKVKIRKINQNNFENQADNYDDNQSYVKYNQDVDEDYLIDDNADYSPKYDNDYSKNFSTYNLDEYYKKVRKLYEKCADCMSTQAEYNNCTSGVKTCINNCKTLADALKDGKIVLTDEEIDNCNKLIENVNGCIKLIGDTKGNLKTIIEEIKPLIKDYNLNIDNCANCYDKILEILDKRIENLKNCKNYLNEIIDIVSNGTNTDDVANNVSFRKYSSNRDNTTLKQKIQYKKLNSNNENKVYNNKQTTSQNNTTRKIRNKRLITNVEDNDTKHRGFDYERFKSLYEKEQTNKNFQTSNNETLNQTNNMKNIQNQNAENQNFTNSNVVNNTNNNRWNNTSANKQAQNAIMNGQNNYPINANGTNNSSIVNGLNYPINSNAVNNSYMYNNGVGNYNVRNVDSYNFFPRNTDTYQNIYTNIDTYGKNYNYYQNNQNANNYNENASNYNENEYYGDDYETKLLNNNEKESGNNSSQNYKIKNGVYKTTEKNFIDRKMGTNLSIKRINKGLPNDNVKDISAPIPSPYDPTKMDEYNEKMRDKESGKFEKENQNIQENEKQKVNVAV